MANTNITLRANKGSALTFTEMDQNFGSYFYSASAFTDSDGFNRLRLHYTGSTLITGDFDNDRYLEVLLPDAQGSTGLSVPGNNNDIIFNDEGVLGADNLFSFDKANNRLGVGTSMPTSTLELHSSADNAELRIFQLDTNSTTTNKAMITINAGVGERIRIGNYAPSETSNVGNFINSCQTLNIGISRNISGQGYSPINNLRIDKVGTLFSGCDNIITPQALPRVELDVRGKLTVSTLNERQGTCIAPISEYTYDGVVASYFPVGATTQGALISSPASPTQGGSIGALINMSNTEAESFSILSGLNNCVETVVTTFKGDGCVGIGTANPVTTLDVRGNISGSNNLTIQGTGIVRGRLFVSNNITGSCHALIDESLTVNSCAIIRCGLQVRGNQSNFNSNSNTHPLNISRIGSCDSQVMKIGVSDRQAIFEYIEDAVEGLPGCYVFKLGLDGSTNQDIDSLLLSPTGAEVCGRVKATGAVCGDSICKTSSHDITPLDITGVGASASSRNVLIADGSTRVIGASSDACGDRPQRLVVTEDFSCQNSTNNIVGISKVHGYWKLSNGLIIQAGQARVKNSGGLGCGTVSFPVAFPTKALSVVISSMRSGAGSSGANHVCNITNSSFCAVVDNACATFIAIGV